MYRSVASSVVAPKRRTLFGTHATGAASSVNSVPEGIQWWIMSEAWNPTIKTPDGEPVSFENPNPEREYKRKDVLELLVGYGCLTKQIARGFGVGENTIRRQMHNNGVEPPGKPDPQNYNGEHTRAAHDAGGAEYHVNQYLNDGEGRVERQASDPTVAEAFQFVICRRNPCPECGRDFPTAEEQHDCIRGHSRGLASYLAGQANAGNEVLELNASE